MAASETAYLGDSFGGDEASSAMAEPLSWRQDPDVSLSDWTIIINDFTRYHVHRNMLGAGQRASQYFMRLFRGAIGTSTSEGESCTSRLELQASSAAAFPIFLDFVYGLDGTTETKKLLATTETGTALIHLGDYLGCRAVHDAAIDFVKADLTWITSPVYFREAELYRLEKLSAAAFNLCSKHFVDISLSNNDGLLKLPPSLFVRVATSIPDRFHGLKVNDHPWCPGIGAYFNGPCAHEMSSADISALTSTLLLPEIDPTDAYGLLEVAIKDQPVDDSKHAVPLATRCIKACTEYWRSALVPLLESEECHHESHLVSTPSKDLAMPSPATETRVQIKRQRTGLVEVPRQAPPLLGSIVPDDTKIQLLTTALLKAGTEVTNLLSQVEDLHDEVKKQKRVSQKARGELACVRASRRKLYKSVEIRCTKCNRACDVPHLQCTHDRFTFADSPSDVYPYFPCNGNVGIIKTLWTDD